MKSIKLKITLMIVVICTLLAATLGLFSILQAQSAITSNTESEMAILAEQVSHSVEASLDADFAYMEALARNPMVCGENVDPVEQKNYLTALLSERGYSDMGVATADGKTLTADMKTIADVSKRPYFITAMSGKRSASDPIEDSTKPGVMIMMMAVPIYRDGQIVGVLYMLNDGAYLSNITNLVKFGKTGGAYMINSEGTNIAHQDASKVITQENAITLHSGEPAFAGIISTLKEIIKGGNGYRVYEYEGVKKCVGYADASEFGWHVVVYAAYDEMFAGYKSIKDGVFIITVIEIVLFCLIGFFITKRMISPINQVEKELTRISEGDFSEEIPSKLTKIKDETGSLARALKRMQDSLYEAISKVKEESAKVIDYANEEAKEVALLVTDVESVSATTQELSASSEETAASTAQMTNAANEAHRAVENIAGRAQDGAKTAGEISERAITLQRSSKESRDKAVEMCKSSVETLGKAIEDSKKVDEINQLSNAILSITSQTNLLALNASIEAARAGEAGKGFAVVATEIGKLAEDSQNSANQIKEVTEGVIHSVDNLSTCAEEILKFLNEVVMGDYDTMVMTGTQYNEDAERISAMVTDLSATTQELYATITNIVSALDEVATATEEAAKGATSIAQNSTDIAGRTEKFSSLTGESIKSTENLKNAVSVFKLNE